jgi:YHS domain-containing protein
MMLSRQRLMLALAVLLLGGAIVLFVVEGRQFQREASAPEPPASPFAPGTGPWSGAVDGGAPAVPSATYSGSYPGAAVPEKQVRCAIHPAELRPVSTMVKVQHAGATYYVCCNDCAREFATDPERYIRELRRMETGSSAEASGAKQEPPPEPESGPAGQGAASAGSSPTAPSSESMVRCAIHPQEKRDRSTMVPVQHKGKTYFVCCADCAARFETDPEFWIAGLREAEKASGR